MTASVGSSFCLIARRNHKVLFHKVQGVIDRLVRLSAASYQVLDNRIVQSCYRDEIQRQFNRSIDDLQLSGQELSTLGISNNSAMVGSCSNTIASEHVGRVQLLDCGSLGKQARLLSASLESNNRHPSM